MIRAVLDTNILISGTLWRGNPYRCLLAGEAGLYELVMSEEILEELSAKLQEKFQHTSSEAAQVAEHMRSWSQGVSIEGSSQWIEADPDDDKFIDTAIAGRASVIVSGDAHLLERSSIEGIEIISARQFLERLRQSPAP